METYEFKGKVWEVKWKSHEFRAEFLKKGWDVWSPDKYFYRLYIDGALSGKYQHLFLSACMSNGKRLTQKIEVDGEEKLFECYLKYRNRQLCPPDLGIIDKLLFKATNLLKSHVIGVLMCVEGKAIYDSTIGDEEEVEKYRELQSKAYS